MISINELFRKDNPFDYVVLGIVMKLLGTIAGFFISYQIADAAFGVISWILIFKGFSLIPGKLSFPFYRKYKTLLKFYLFLCVVMIVRGYMIDYNYIWFTTVGAINYHLFQPTYIICYLMPFAALIPLRYLNFRVVLAWSSIIILFNLVMLIIFRHEVMQTSLMAAMGLDEEEGAISASSLSFCTSIIFLSLFYQYIPFKKWRILLLGVILALACTIIGGRRGGTVLFLIMLSGSLYFYTLTKKGFITYLSRIIIGLAVAGAVGCPILIACDQQDNSYIPESLINLVGINEVQTLTIISDLLTNQENTEKLSEHVRACFSWDSVSQITQKTLSNI